MCAKNLATPMKSTYVSGSLMLPKSAIFKWGKYLTCLVYQYCPILVYLHGLEQTSIILKLTILE